MSICSRTWNVTRDVCNSRCKQLIWVVPKIGGVFSRVPILRIVVLLGLYWDPPILGNYHISKSLSCNS